MLLASHVDGLSFLAIGNEVHGKREGATQWHAIGKTSSADHHQHHPPRGKLPPPAHNGGAGSRAPESGLRGEKALQQMKRWDSAKELCLLDLMASGPPR